MRSTPTILKTTGAILLVLSLVCVPNFAAVGGYAEKHARERFVDDLEKTMTPEELTKMFSIPTGLTGSDRSSFMRRQLMQQRYLPGSPAGIYLFAQSVILGIGMITLGILESRSRRIAKDRALRPVVEDKCATCGYDMRGHARGTACPECAGKQA